MNIEGLELGVVIVVKTKSEYVHLPSICLVLSVDEYSCLVDADGYFQNVGYSNNEISIVGKTDETVELAKSRIKHINMWS